MAHVIQLLNMVKIVSAYQEGVAVVAEMNSIEDQDARIFRFDLFKHWGGQNGNGLLIRLVTGTL